MAITWLIENEKTFGPRKVIKALLRENGTVKRAQVNIAHDANPTMADVQAAWDAAQPLANGVALWNQLELEAADDISRNTIGAFLDVVRGDGTLLQMVTALEGVIDDDPKLLIAYNRIRAAFVAGSAANQAKFITAAVTLVYYRLGQRVK